MLLRDEEALNYLAVAILLAFPWLGTVLGTWGVIWGALILVAVFLVGRRRGLAIAAFSLLIGYVVPLIVFGAAAFNLMSFVPFAGLLGVLGWQKNWPVRVTFFWSAALASVLGTVPTLMGQAVSALNESDMMNMTIQQYQASGLLAAMQQQGLTEVQFRDVLQQVIHIYALILPSFAALLAVVEFGFVFYFVRIWLKEDDERIPFTHWRLPWYAVWGAVLGIAFYLLGDQFAWTSLRGLGINIMVFYGALTLVLGASVFVYLLKSPKIPRFFKFALILASFIYLFFSVVSLIMFGLFDIVFNFRRLPEES
ncbi:DUF2232 domain-containing protein [Desulfosporosinus fructosivorans]|uniref:DUF2232 domain-containing protein n=1 Tax=Desulfosporosinus fructosivorans TaxID=2018669 RepID=A0A4Z0R356_9FIRM|nr:DUF2232 domain-containing protein [Desulfosporosinus fructosivorans]TGE36563.1 DUF2232 domain-containing protein [Desulfosporosinus fructosivorans]